MFLDRSYSILNTFWHKNCPASLHYSLWWLQEMIGRAQTDSSENKVRLYLRRRPLPCIILCRSFERLVLTFIIAPLPHLFLLLLFSIRPMRAVRGFFITLQQESRELITEDRSYSIHGLRRFPCHASTSREIIQMWCWINKGFLCGVNCWDTKS